MSILIVLFWTDIEERLLPDEFTLGGTLVGLILAAFVPMHSVSGREPDSVRPVRVFNRCSIPPPGRWCLPSRWPGIGWLYQRVRGRVGLGLGDVKLLASHRRLPWEPNVVWSLLLIGSVSGSVVGVTYILVRRKDSQTYQLPFGSFLCAGAVISALWNGEISLLLGVR